MAKNIKIDTFKKKVEFIHMIMNSTDVFQLKTVNGEFINFYDIAIEEQLAEGVKTDAKDGEYVFVDKTVIIENGVVKEIKYIEPEETEEPEEQLADEVVNKEEESTEENPEVSKPEKTIEENPEVSTEENPEVSKPEKTIEEKLIRLNETLEKLSERLTGIEERITKLEESGREVMNKVKNLSKFSTEPIVKKFDIVDKIDKVNNNLKFSFKRN